MSKSVHPYAHRLIILRDWKSRWFASEKDFKEYLRSDVLVRQWLLKKMKGFFVSSVEMERNKKTTKIIIRTSRPGMIIGRNGEGATKLKDEIVKMMKKNKIAVPTDLSLDVIEITNPEADANIVGQMIAEALEKRMPYRRVMKQMIEKIMATRGVLGARILMSGRLGGAEIARTEDLKRGSIPLQTFRADIDFARVCARLAYGGIGIKVWIYKGLILDKDKNK